MEGTTENPPIATPVRKGGPFQPGYDPRRCPPDKLAASRKAGAVALRRKSREQVAQIARRLESVEESLMWLLQVSRGIDPDADPTKGHPPIDMSMRFAAKCRFMAYQIGLPAQQIQLEGRLAAVVASVETRAGGRTFEQVLSGAGQLEQAREDARTVVAELRRRAEELALGAAARAASPEATGDSDVPDGAIDAEYTDVPDPDGAP